MNVMRQLRIEKLTLNIGAGKDQAKLEKGLKLLKSITGAKPVKTVTQKRIAGWGIRPGLPIGCKLTLRKEKAKDILMRALDAKEFTLKARQFDLAGNLSFGVHEYIDIKNAKYDPEIGIMGLEICVTFERPGYRIKRRRLYKKSLGKKHLVTKEEAMEFMKNNFNVKIEEED